MCGIFGILNSIQKDNIYNIIIDGLIQLQNRGYDSSGLCTLNNNNFEIHKYASTNEMSSIDKLLNDQRNNQISSEINGFDTVWRGTSYSNL